MKTIIGISVFLFLTSCLKEIEQVETANDNIYDETYEGGQWFVLEDVYQYTNTNNDVKIRFEVSVPAENAPELKPTQIKTRVLINDTEEVFYDIPITTNSDYEGIIEIDPLGGTNYCMEMGVYIENEDLTINSFSACSDL